MDGMSINQHYYLSEGCKEWQERLLFEPQELTIWEENEYR